MSNFCRCGCRNNTADELCSLCQRNSAPMTNQPAVPVLPEAVAWTLRFWHHDNKCHDRLNIMTTFRARAEAEAYAADCGRPIRPDWPCDPAPLLEPLYTAAQMHAYATAALAAAGEDAEYKAFRDGFLSGHWHGQQSPNAYVDDAELQNDWNEYREDRDAAIDAAMQATRPVDGGKGDEG